MVEPITGAAAVGSIMSFKGQRAAGKAAQQVSEYNAQVKENEAVLLARQKRDHEESIRMQSRQLIGSQRVATAASGVQMSGSPLMAMADAYLNTERDIANLRYASTIEQTEAEQSASLTRMEGQLSNRAAQTQAYATLLGGVSQAYYQDKQMKAIT